MAIGISISFVVSCKTTETTKSKNTISNKQPLISNNNAKDSTKKIQIPVENKSDKNESITKPKANETKINKTPQNKQPVNITNSHEDVINTKPVTPQEIKPIIDSKPHKENDSENLVEKDPPSKEKLIANEIPLKFDNKPKVEVETKYKYSYGQRNQSKSGKIKASFSYRTNNEVIANKLFTIQKMLMNYAYYVNSFRTNPIGPNEKVEHNYILLDDILTFRSRYVNAECLNDIGRETIRRVKLTPNQDNKFIMRWEVYEGGVLEYALNHELTLNELNKFLANMDEWTLDR